ncbi:hypothetical protein GCM10023176_40030 [Micromonospora coerulea]|uniref:Homeodomain-like domain-containing protein n=1 Tax=Micromonospora coerulea TaxID=47856 RepID=A0ABP8SSE4_9ACTN
MRAKIILACAEGGSNTEVAAALGVHLSAVGKWRRRVGTCDGATPTLATPTSSPPNAGNEPASAPNVSNAGDGPEAEAA